MDLAVGPPPGMNSLTDTDGTLKDNLPRYTAPNGLFDADLEPILYNCLSGHLATKH
jgi:hypothetical protein